MTQVLPQTIGGQQLPGGNRHGKIPRRDHAADADRLAHGHGEFVGQLRRNCRAEHTAAFASVVVGGVDGLLHVAASFVQHFAHFAGHLAGIVFFAFDENFGGAKNDFGAARRGHESPLREGALGSVDGSVNIRFGRFLKDADHVARIGGIAIFERLAGRGFDPLAVDEILEDFGRNLAKRGRRCQSVGCHNCSL